MYVLLIIKFIILIKFYKRKDRNQLITIIKSKK